ncbi:MAG TPA: EAL domain-containing protein [Burkholderiales bacterium]|nr:EAL domain-containing protein [Burkholderiales bacterium]
MLRDARRLSLRTWFLLLVLIAVLPVVAIMVWGALHARAQRIQNAYSVEQSVARVSALAQQRLLESARLLLVGLADAPEVRRRDFAQCARYFATVRPAIPHLANLGFADLQGRLLCSALPLPQAINIADREYFVRALRRGAFAAGSYQVGRATHLGSVAFGIPVEDASGRAAGVAFAAFDLGVFAPFPDAARLPSHPQFLTVDRHGVVLAAAPAAAGLIGRPIPVAPLRAALSAGRAGIIEAPGLHGEATMYAFAPAQLDREVGLYVVIGVPKASIVGPVDRTLAQGLAMLAAAVLAFCGLAWIGYERWVVRPVDRLIAAADAVAGGELSARASGPGPVAEYARMQDRFNRMAQTLEERERLLAGLVEVSADWYWEQDAELRFKSFPDNLLQPAHFPVREYLGKRRWETPHFGVSEAQWAAHRATLEAHKPFRDFVMGRLDDQGRPCYLSVSGRPTFDHGGTFTGYQGVSTDVTERISAGVALRASEVRYRTLVDLLPDAVFTHRDGRILFMSPAGIRLYGGTSAAEFEGRSVLDLVDPSAHAMVATRLSALYERGDTLPIAEIPQRRLDRSAFHAEVHTTLVEIDRAMGSLSVVRDVTQRRRMEEALRASEEQYRALFDKNPSPMWVFRHDDLRFMAVNEAAVAHYGYSKAEFLAMTIGDIRPADDVPRLLAEELEPRAAARDHGQWRHRKKDGSIIDVHVMSYGIVFEGASAHLVLATDITERLRYERQIEHLATHDSLTGLPNRSLLVELTAQMLSSARRLNRYAALLLLDLDNFKLHNDSFGHQGGDTLLKEVSARITPVLRRGDTLARLGGDEFVALLADLRRPEDVSAVVAKIRGALGEPFRVAGQEVFVTASIGVSLFPADGQDLDTLVRHADTAMYKAKELGRDDVQYFTPELNRRAAERLAIEVDLRRALERGEFAVFYQPQVDLRTRRIVGAEALVRWNHPVKGLVPPAQFIQIAEDSGLIVSIGHWILEDGCRQLRTWLDGGMQPLRLSFNLSPRQFRDKSLLASIADAIAGAGVSAGQIELELTESLVMGSADSFQAALTALKQLGVGLAIDDFGTGYSSLSYLKRFPIDKLKIDQSFVRDLEGDPDDAAIVRTVIALGQSLKLKVIAEGVETFGQLEFLRLHGCDEIQGYYVAPPMSAPEFERFVQRGLPGELWLPPGVGAQ